MQPFYISELLIAFINFAPCITKVFKIFGVSFQPKFALHHCLFGSHKFNRILNDPDLDDPSFLFHLFDVAASLANDPAQHVGLYLDFILDNLKEGTAIIN